MSSRTYNVNYYLDTKLIDSKNSDNSEVNCFCCCGYDEVVFEIRAEIVFISGYNNEQSK
jgi:hypothetical protein